MHGWYRHNEGPSATVNFNSTTLCWASSVGSQHVVSRGVAAQCLQLSISISCLQGAQQQNCRPLMLLSINGIDRQMDVRKNAWTLHLSGSAYYAGMSVIFKSFFSHTINTINSKSLTRTCNFEWLINGSLQNCENRQQSDINMHVLHTYSVTSNIMTTMYIK